MRMEYKASKKLAQETIEYANEMTPMDRNDFIDLMSDQYHIAIHRRYPKREVKKGSLLEGRCLQMVLC